MLNEKEKTIVQGLAEGKPQKQIAGDMGITEAGVKWYLSSLFDRYDVANNAELTAYCVGKGWITIQKHSEREA
jgi:DNA-binding NarL/FixJ family response regulator